MFAEPDIDERDAEIVTHDLSQLSNDHCYQISPLACAFNGRTSPGCYLINNIEAVVPLGLVKAQYEVSYDELGELVMR